MTAADAKTSSAPRGFDSPVVSRQEDHLNRWPLAREVFGIATTGPADWSVRIGIYGEWGSGKSTVLGFVGQMAEEEGHVLIRFNPWQYSNREALWRAFVLAIYSKPEFRGLERAGWVYTKKRALTILGLGKPLEEGVSFINEKASKALGTGIDLLKGMFRFGKDDLKALSARLGSKRVIVLIDDLDRTAAELVPEILYALKELMDIPRFAFICAFDPVVVGQVLGESHPGFGDGLKFLDKIIDYPRWLPPASTDGLANLSVAEAARSCPYVPQTAIRDAVPLLPKNPRAVRQFIRLLTLLKPPIERHYDYELKWPVILTANILKIRHPCLAHELLNAPSFWSSIGVISLTSRDHDEGKNLDAAISEHIDKAYANLGLQAGEPVASEKKDLKNLLQSICSHVALFSGLDEQGVAYQVNVAESPAAVTWKEFDSFLAEWKSNQATDTAKSWIAAQAQRIERAEVDVYRELLNESFDRYAQALHKADNVFTEAEKPTLITEAASLLALLNVLVFDLGRLDQPVKQIGDAELELLVDKWTRFVGASLPVHTEFWPRNEAFILALFEKWSPDVMPLIRILGPYTGVRLRSFDHNTAAAGLHKQLCDVALPKFARQLISSFREPDFIERLVHKEENTFEARCIMWDVKGPLWGALRNEFLQVLAEAPSNRSIQSNAYEFLHWFILRCEGHGPGDPKAMQALLSEQAVFDALWNAATATLLAPRAVYQIRTLPGIVHKLGTSLKLPSWWIETTKTFITPAPAPPGPDAPSSTAPEEEPT